MAQRMYAPVLERKGQAPYIAAHHSSTLMKEARRSIGEGFAGDTWRTGWEYAKKMGYRIRVVYVMTQPEFFEVTK